MFNRKLNTGLFACTLTCCLFLLSACTQESHNSSHVSKQLKDTAIRVKKVDVVEYIIVLKKDVKVTDAVNSLKIYDVQVIKDLKRDRYLIGVKNDHGIDKLKKDIVDSEYIKHIQLNFIYSTQ